MYVWSLHIPDLWTNFWVMKNPQIGECTVIICLVDNEWRVTKIQSSRLFCHLHDFKIRRSRDGPSWMGNGTWIPWDFRPGTWDWDGDRFPWDAWDWQKYRWDSRWDPCWSLRRSSNHRDCFKSQIRQNLNKSMDQGSPISGIENTGSVVTMLRVWPQCPNHFRISILISVFVWTKGTGWKVLNMSQ